MSLLPVALARAPLPGPLDTLQLVSLVGALMQLAVYALMQFGRLPIASYPYQLANTVGSLLMATVASFNREYGFILMEGVWFLTSAYGLLRLIRRRADPSHAG